MRSGYQNKVQAGPVQSFTPAGTGLLQRTCTLCNAPGLLEDSELDAEGLTLQRSPVDQAEPSTVPPVVHEVLRSPGQPLDVATRAHMEPRFGHDFSRVRVHTDAKAADSARAVNAQAYTVGSNIVFQVGKYTPRTMAGKRLLAHELTHTIQQNNVPRANLMIAQHSDQYEWQAEEASRMMTFGSKVPQIQSFHKEAIQRRVSEQEEVEWERVNPAGRFERTYDREVPVLIFWNFSVGSHTLKAEHINELDNIRFRNLLRDFIVIEGHTSSTGSDERNQVISERRANAVEAYLQRRGVFGRQMIANGLGDSDPWVPDNTPENMARNRRVMIRGGLLT
jgi:outer membrane protein OmpA-like peptidoglycan-associated protein